MSYLKEIAKHSSYYLVATLATKALAFISLPVYTYLLTVEEFGIYNIFLSTVGIATVIMTLNTEVAISRYYFDADGTEDFKRFVGCSVWLSSAVFGLMSVLIILFSKQLSFYLGFNELLVISIIPVSLYSVINSIFQQIYQPMLQSKKIAIVSSVQSYLAFFFSTVFILLLEDKKYYGLVYGTIAAMLLLGVYSINQIKAYCKGCWNKKYVKYILSYSLPYLPYSLSGIIIAQFGKLIIGRYQGYESAGVYSFASNIGMIMLIMISVVHSAWNPYYFRYMNKQDYSSVDRDYSLIWKVTLLFAAVLSLFGYELGHILGKKEYFEGLRLIPILVIGYCFYQWSYVYMRNVGYAKKTIWNAVVVVISGIVNVLLNSVLIAKYKDLGVALSFTISYLVMLITSWGINKYILKVYAPKVKAFLPLLIASLPLFIIGYFCKDFRISFAFIMVKLFLLLVFSVLMLLPDLKKIL